MDIDTLIVHILGGELRHNDYVLRETMTTLEDHAIHGKARGLNQMQRLTCAILAENLYRIVQPH